MTSNVLTGALNPVITN